MKRLNTNNDLVSVIVLLANVYFSFVLIGWSTYCWHPLRDTLLGWMILLSPMIKVDPAISWVYLSVVVALCLYAGYSCPWRGFHFGLLVVGCWVGFLFIKQPPFRDFFIFNNVYLAIEGLLYLAGYKLYRFRLKSQKDVLPVKIHP